MVLFGDPEVCGGGDRVEARVGSGGGVEVRAARQRVDSASDG